MSLLKKIIITYLIYTSLAHNLTSLTPNVNNLVLNKRWYKENMFNKVHLIKVNGCTLYYDEFYKKYMFRCLDNFITSIHPVLNITLPSVNIYKNNYN